MKPLSQVITAITALSIKNPKLTICLFIFITLLFSSQIHRLHFETSGESFLQKTDPARLAYEDFESKYGISAYFVILIEGDDLFSQEKISRLIEFESTIKKHTPYVASVESILNSTFVSHDEDDIYIGALADDVFSALSAEEKKALAISQAFFKDRLINASGDTTALLVRLKVYTPKKEGRKRLSVLDVQRTLESLEKSIHAFQPYFAKPILLGGSPVVTTELTQITKSEMLLFATLSVLVVAVVMYSQFHSIPVIVLPLMLLLMTVLQVIGAMALNDRAVHVTGSILPSFLIAICIGDSVHFIKHYFVHQRAEINPHENAIRAIEHSGVALFFTSLTTFLGLISFGFSHVEPISSFGIYAAIGIWIAFILTISFLPACFVALSITAHPKYARATKFAFSSSTYVQFLSVHKIKIIAMSLLLTISSSYLASKLSFTYNPLTWFKPEHPVKQSSAIIEQKLAGIMQVELLINTANSEALAVQQLNEIDQWLSRQIREHSSSIPIKGESSILVLLKEANRVLTDSQIAELPMSNELLAQELLLLKLNASDTVEQLISEDQSEIRVTLSIPWQDSLAFNAFVQSVADDFSYTFKDTLRLRVTGLASVGNKAFGDMVVSMSYSYLIAFVTILLCIAVLIRNPLYSAITMYANSLPLLMTLALMTVFSIPLDLFTLLIACVALGIVVDDSIHFMQTFKRYADSGLSIEQALIATIDSTGMALTTTTLILSVAFLVYGFSQLNNLVYFGLLTSVTILFALIADVVLVPALLLAFYNKKNNVYK